jgi:hypothetical protein
MQTVIEKVFGLGLRCEFDNKPDRDNPGQRRVPEAQALGRGERILVVDDHPVWLVELIYREVLR